jgi:hypothetical protein
MTNHDSKWQGMGKTAVRGITVAMMFATKFVVVFSVNTPKLPFYFLLIKSITRTTSV